jgi:hypothetical protein
VQHRSTARSPLEFLLAAPSLRAHPSVVQPAWVHNHCWLMLGLGVMRACRQLLRLLQQNSEQAQDAAWSLPLADLQQWVLSSAARLLKPELAAAGHAGESPAGGEPEGGQEDRAAGTGALRAHPLVSATCQLLELLVLLEATDVGSPAVCAGEAAGCTAARVWVQQSALQCSCARHAHSSCLMFVTHRHAACAQM